MFYSDQVNVPIVSNNYLVYTFCNTNNENLTPKK